MVDNLNQFSKLLNQKGQALFEMILFLPFMIFLVTIYYTCGNSINGSINQQKATRGYFYMLVRNNAFLNSQSDLAELSSKGLKTIGFSAIGWRDHGVEQEAFAPCFKFSSILNNSSSEDCDGKSPDAAEGSSRFVRVYTYYGVCGASYVKGPTSGLPYIVTPEAQLLANIDKANNCFNEN